MWNDVLVAPGFSLQRRTRLLILSCSKAKRSDPGSLPAIERYDGPDFRVLRRYLRSRPTEPPHVYVLSAKLGLIPASAPVTAYDRRINKERAEELRPLIRQELEQILDRGYRDILVDVGRDYQSCLRGLERLISGDEVVQVVDGSHGKRLFQLKKWLYGYSGLIADQAIPSGRTVRLRGVTLDLTPEVVTDLARRALVDGQGQSERYHGWYAVVDGQRVSVKWLASLLTGLRVGTFGATEARRALMRLGIEVRPV